MAYANGEGFWAPLLTCVANPGGQTPGEILVQRGSLCLMSHRQPLALKLLVVEYGPSKEIEEPEVNPPLCF